MIKQLKHLAAAPVLLLAAVAANALPQVSDEKGVTGYVAGGVGFVNIDSNTVAGNSIIDLDNDRLNSNDLNRSPSSRSTGIPVVLGEVRWNLGRRNELFFGTSVENAVTLDSSTELGWRKGTDNAGTFQVGLVVNRLIPVEVYADPFLTGDKRRKTDSVRQGVRFQWDRIFNTAFEWQITARNIDVDKDRNGQSLVPGNPSNPATLPDGVNFITLNELGLLERDADELSTRISYLIKAGGGHSVRPLIGYKKRDADGDAESFDSIRAQLTYAFQNEDVLFTANAIFANREYDERNPIYDDYRDSTNVALSATVLVPMEFADGNWSWFATALWGEDDSDIDFYDQEATQLAAGVQYNFGRK